ncbi:hypothetical protein KUG85_10440 [Nitratireductor sp. L1-7-SE]|uniref:Uncharacterized protein n=1 Tax=Nitratireductor rhodophyticola TaxID=2854036 RepID=A0ABS7RAX0_9HYPH|nr:hypothetical protein [Nitratireductor rhodophyticola]MBY8918073.1 hypothetical protein [Nitratireductor rhodophyticola]MBY8921118.1 hypothetical protein [Nitratireductor rhodophyticola]
MVDTEMLAARMRGEAAWVRLLAAAGRLERALKRNPRWHIQPRVPAGNPGGGRWTDGGGSVVVPASGRASRIARMRRRYPGASLAQITRLEIAVSQARYHVGRVRRLDRNWRGSTSATSTIHGEILHFEAVARQARERFHELTRGAVPDFNPLWGRKRLLKELFRNGYRFERNAKSGNGVIYRNQRTGEAVRIMASPRGNSRTTVDAKILSKFYYRYRMRDGLKEQPHTPIPDTD